MNSSSDLGAFMEQPGLGVTDPFLSKVGKFYGIWSTTELAIDYAVGKFLSLPFEETHLLTAGMEFNRKARLLMALLNRSDHPQKNVMINSVKTIQNESLRNVLAHSFMEHEHDYVVFVERSRHGSYNPTRHKFTLPEFSAHVENLYEASVALHDAIGMTDEEVQKFGDAAFNVKNRSTASPVAPNDKA